MTEWIDMPAIASLLGRLYFQYIIIIAIAVLFAYILNTIFAVDDAEVRIMLSSVFLAFFAGAVLLLGRYGSRE
jgi:ABC-type transport system involved in cytochrome bd biosynthesis fused ATPase/permease subunit